MHLIITFFLTTTGVHGQVLNYYFKSETNDKIVFNQNKPFSLNAYDKLQLLVENIRKI